MRPLLTIFIKLRDTRFKLKYSDGESIDVVELAFEEYLRKFKGFSDVIRQWQISLLDLTQIVTNLLRLTTPFGIIRQDQEKTTSPAHKEQFAYPAGLLAYAMAPARSRGETDIQKESQKRPNQARDGKPKSVKVKSQPNEENTT
ncbi:hypothetical protein Tco_0427819 [Tanacetum coccineum]